MFEIIVPPTKRIYTDLERFEPAAPDASSRGVAKNCLRKYFFSIVLGFKPTGINHYLQFGSVYHKFREVLEKEWMEHKDQNKAYETAITVARIMWKGDPNEGVKNDFLTMKRLIKSCEYAFEEWKKEKAQGQIEVLSVEQPFDIFLSDGKTRRGGKIDQILRWVTKPWIRDFKTSTINEEYYQRYINPNDQFSGYTSGGAKLIGEDVWGVFVEVLYNTKTVGPKIYNLKATRTNGQLKQWEEDQIAFEQILNMCRELDMWPANESHCRFCDFHSVCKLPTVSSQQAQLIGNFKQQPWDYKATED